ncbi:MAG: ABC transporter substrate-binding protein [Pseudomonadota bacterium]
MLRIFILVLTAFMLAATSNTADAGPEAESVISQAAAELSQGALTPDELADLVDIEAVARFTLGRHADTLSADEISDYTDAFGAFLETTFDAHADRFVGADVTVVDSRDRSARDSVVTVQVAFENRPPETVRWRVLSRGATWKIVDVQVQGLWLAIEQRAQITAILESQGGLDAATRRLREDTGESAAD